LLHYITEIKADLNAPCKVVESRKQASHNLGKERSGYQEGSRATIPLFSDVQQKSWNGLIVLLTSKGLLLFGWGFVGFTK
jgi:hypothetical protein